MNKSETGVQKANAYKLEQDAEDAMTEKLEEKMLSEDLKQKLLNKERELLDAENRIIALQNENTLLRKKLTAAENKLECMTKRVFDIERFKCDENISFYTGFPKYNTFVATYEFLNLGVEGENIRNCSSSERGIPDAFYDQLKGDDLETERRNDKQGRLRKLKPFEEFFMVMCRLPRGFALQHLSHLFGVATSTVSRIFTAWVNFMYLKFAQINIWPSREAVTKTMPEVFKDKYPSTRVIIDCTEIKCEMPSSLLLNTELFSSYKNHMTLKGLIGIAPNGAVTFISQLYTGSISDREIVIRSGFLEQEFSEGDSVMADKGLTIQDLLPLGTSLNIPPFLGQFEQMNPENVIRVTDSKYRESLDRFEKSKTLRLCLKNAKILLQFSKNLTSSRNSQKTKIHLFTSLNMQEISGKLTKFLLFALKQFTILEHGINLAQKFHLSFI